MSGPKLGRRLIKSMGGRDLPLTRRTAGYYYRGKYFNRPANEAQPIEYEDSAAVVQAKLREIAGLSGVVCSGAGLGDVGGILVTFPAVGAQPLIEIQSETFNGNVQITRATPGDSMTQEVQRIRVILSDLDDTDGHVILYWGSISSLTVFACPQPLSGRETLAIPEGDRNRERLKLYSADELRVKDEVTKADADVVEVDGKLFKVESVQAWSDYWKAIVVSVEPDEEP